MKKLWRNIVVFFCRHEYVKRHWLDDRSMCSKCGDIHVPVPVLKGTAL